MASLQVLTIEHIQRNGPITFAEYMRMALYEPHYGYYVTGAARMGWQGDYYTSTDVSPLFAHCMGRQLVQCWHLLRNPTPFVVVEQGAGRGDLAQAIQQWAKRQHPDFFAALDYRTEDIRGGQDARTEATLHETDQPPTKPSVLLSNELVDAFPVHVVALHEQQLYEVYVDVQDGRLQEVLASPHSTELAAYLDTYNPSWRMFPDGWRAEINLDAIRWMERCAQLLTGTTGRRKHHGFLITIDYGDKARALYTPERYHGTLACYFQHQFSERPLLRPGQQDITAHVNFSALITTGRQHGLRLHSFTTQRVWLEQMGIFDELAHIRQHDFAAIDSQRASDRGQIELLQWYNLRQRVAALTASNGMGNFKVLLMKS
jgi:SAM-dependent MidA family methyltransferase